MSIELNLLNIRDESIWEYTEKVYTRMIRVIKFWIRGWQMFEMKEEEIVFWNRVSWDEDRGNE